MKLLLYIAAGFLAIFLAVTLITRTEAPDSNPFIMLAIIILFGIPPFGGFWMMYVSIRYEKNPFPLILLAFIPFTFLWYYFERVRAGKVRMIRNFD